MWLFAGGMHCPEPGWVHAGIWADGQSPSGSRVGGGDWEMSGTVPNSAQGAPLTGVSHTVSHCSTKSRLRVMGALSVCLSVVCICVSIIVP